jgi:hypothetical protein
MTCSSKITCFQIGLNTGVGYNKWELSSPSGNTGETTGISIVNNLDFLYRINRVKIGAGLGFDYYFFNAYVDNNTTFFPKIYVQTEYLSYNGFFVNGPGLQFGYAWYNLQPSRKVSTFWIGVGWTLQRNIDRHWSLILKPGFEYKWPRELMDEGEKIYSGYFQIGVRFRA